MEGIIKKRNRHDTRGIKTERNREAIPFTEFFKTKISMEYKPTILFIKSRHFSVGKQVKQWVDEKFNLVCINNEHQELYKIGRFSKPDIVLIDSGVNENSSYYLYNELYSMFKNTPYVFLTTNRFDEEKINSLFPCVVDHIILPLSKEKLLNRLNFLVQIILTRKQNEFQEFPDDYNGIPDKIRDELVRERCLDYGCSKRELEVALLLSVGYYYKEIGNMLHISIKTVSTYIQRLYKKTGTHNKIECMNILTREREDRVKSQNIV